MASTSDLGLLNVPENVQGGDNVTSKTVAPYECNYIIRTPQVEITYERRHGKGSQEKKEDLEPPEVLATDGLNNLAMDYLVVDALIYLKNSPLHPTSKPGTHNASLVEASSSKAYESNDAISNDCKASTSKTYESNDAISNDCKASTSKAYEPVDSDENDCKTKCKRKQSSSTQETLKNTITKSPKQEKRRRCRWYPQKSSRAYRLVTEFGHKLINYDIRVWWPIDQEFFRGTIVHFDPQSKRHTIHYLDDDVEFLDLTNECWHFAELEKLNPILELETYKGPPPPRPKSRGGSKKRRRH